MAGAKKAKVASSKGAKVKFTIEGKAIKPCVLLAKGRRMVCAEFETGGIVLDATKSPLSWKGAMLVAIKA